MSGAVVRLLADKGYAAMSIEQVASMANVAKTAIYRRWGSKAEMVFAVAVHGESIDPLPDSGSLAIDVGRLAERVVALLSMPAARQAMPGLLSDLRGNAVLAERFEDVFIAAERRLIEGVLHRARLRGDLVSGVDPADVHAQLLGTAFAWLFLMGGQPPDDVARRITAALLATLEK